MNGKFILVLTLFVTAISVAGSARAASDRVAMGAVECAPGYHVYRDGSCQSDSMVVDSRCAPGFTAQVFPNGNDYRCVPQSWTCGQECADP